MVETNPYLEHSDVANALTFDGVLNTEAYEQARQLIEGEGFDDSAVLTYIDHWYREDFTNFAQSFMDDYMGLFGTIEDFAEDIYKAMVGVPEELDRYINWTQAGDDLLQYDFFTDGYGNYFRTR